MTRARRTWTPQEDAALRRAVNTVLSESRPLLWRELAKSVPGRSNKDCRRRWWNSLAAGTTKGPWSEEEDERLIEAVRQHGFTWTRVAQAVMTRNADQCSSHWIHVLDPGINHSDWTATEDSQLLHEVLTHGTNWAIIATTHVPKRTTLALKNRYSTMRLCNENSRKKGKKQGGESETKASSRSPDTCNVAISCESQEPRSGRGFDNTGLNSENHMGEQEDEVDYDDDDDDDDNGSGSEYNANDAGDHSLGFFDQDMTMSNGSVPRRDIVNPTTSSGLWTDYPDCNGSGLHLPSVIRQNGRLTPLLTPTRTWTPATTDQSASSTTFKSALFSPAHQMQSSSDTLPRDYSNFVGNVHNFAGNMHEAANDPMVHPYQLSQVDMVSSRSPDIMGLRMQPQMPELLDRNQSPPVSTTNTVSGDGSHQASDTDPEKPNVRASACYQVDLVIICSSAQIEAIMKGVEGIGVLKSMKIGPRRTSSTDSRNS